MLLAIPAAAPSRAQNDQTADQSSGRFRDAVTQTRMRAVPRRAAPSALVSRVLEGFTERSIDAFDAVPAIVVAPSSMSQDERDEFARTFRATPDGYFARLTRDDYDVVINGTLAYSVPPASLRFRRRTGRFFVQKAQGETDISFSDFGGDYLIQFICHEYDEDQIGGCVDDDEATALFDRMVPLGGGLD